MSKHFKALACAAAIIFQTLAHAEPGPLMAAVLSGEVSAVRSALDAGANPNAVDPELSRLPLHAAVAPGGPRDPDIASLLVTRGARIGAEDAQTGLTPLMSAMVIVERGPFASVERARASALVERLVKLGANPNQAPKNGDTPLMLAVTTDNLDMVRTLLSLGADPNQRNARQASALHAAHALGRRQEMIAALTGAGADPSLRDAQGVTSLQSRGGVSIPAPLAAAPVPATEAPAQPAAPEPAPAAEADKSNLSTWLIGGAMVAATVVAAVLLANHSRDQKRKRENERQSAVAPVAAAPAPPVVSPAPVVVPTPPVRPAPIPSIATREVLIEKVSLVPEQPEAGRVMEMRAVLRNFSDRTLDKVSFSVVLQGAAGGEVARRELSLAPRQQMEVVVPLPAREPGPVRWLVFASAPTAPGVPNTNVPSQSELSVTIRPALVAAPHPTPGVVPAPQPSPAANAREILIDDIRITPEKPEAGQPIAMRITLRNGGFQLDGAGFQVLEISAAKTVRPVQTQSLRLSPQQKLEVIAQLPAREAGSATWVVSTLPGGAGAVERKREFTATIAPKAAPVAVAPPVVVPVPQPAPAPVVVTPPSPAPNPALPLMELTTVPVRPAPGQPFTMRWVLRNPSGYRNNITDFIVRGIIRNPGGFSLDNATLMLAYNSGVVPTKLFEQRVRVEYGKEVRMDSPQLGGVNAGQFGLRVIAEPAVTRPGGPTSVAMQDLTMTVAGQAIPAPAPAPAPKPIVTPPAPQPPVVVAPVPVPAPAPIVVPPAVVVPAPPATPAFVKREVVIESVRVFPEKPEMGQALEVHAVLRNTSDQLIDVVLALVQNGAGVTNRELRFAPRGQMEIVVPVSVREPGSVKWQLQLQVRPPTGQPLQRDRDGSTLHDFSITVAAKPVPVATAQPALTPAPVAPQPSPAPVIYREVTIEQFRLAPDAPQAGQPATLTVVLRNRSNYQLDKAMLQVSENNAIRKEVHTQQVRLAPQQQIEVVAPLPGREAGLVGYFITAVPGDPTPPKTGTSFDPGTSRFDMKHLNVMVLAKPAPGTPSAPGGVVVAPVPVPVGPAPSQALRLKDLGLVTTRYGAGISASSADAIDVFEPDTSVSLYLDPESAVTQPVTLQLVSSNPSVFPVPASVVVAPGAARRQLFSLRRGTIPAPLTQVVVQVQVPGTSSVLGRIRVDVVGSCPNGERMDSAHACHPIVASTYNPCFQGGAIQRRDVDCGVGGSPVPPPKPVPAPPRPPAKVPGDTASGGRDGRACLNISVKGSETILRNLCSEEITVAYCFAGSQSKSSGCGLHADATNPFYQMMTNIKANSTDTVYQKDVKAAACMGFINNWIGDEVRKKFRSFADGRYSCL